jgi:hypothetical protein
LKRVCRLYLHYLGALALGRAFEPTKVSPQSPSTTPEPSSWPIHINDAVVAQIRKRYLTILAKIDAAEPLDKDEGLLFRMLTGEKPTAGLGSIVNNERHHKKGSA